MSDLQEYKCPACGGSLEFNADSQRMKCPFCDSEFDMEALKSKDEALDKASETSLEWGQSAGQQWDDGEIEGLKVYSCKSCGGEIVGEDNIGATSCPYCGSQVVMTGQFSGDLKPDYVIPFKVNKQAAKNKVREYASGRKYVPKMFRDENHIDEIKGIYVPVWLFDANVNADINYVGKNMRHWSDSDYNYTETETFNIMRSGSISFEKIPVDGSEKMEDDLMESIEPFDFDGAVDFQTAYLAGYLAERYDVNEEQSISRANERIEQSTIDAFRKTVQGYNVVEKTSANLNMNSGKASYALYPVWILNTTYRGEHFKFAVNGQTGKTAGDMPVDEGALWRYFGICTAVCSAVLYGLLWIFV